MKDTGPPLRTSRRVFPSCYINASQHKDCSRRLLLLQNHWHISCNLLCPFATMPAPLSRYGQEISFSVPPPSLSAKQISYLVRNLSPEDLHAKILDVVADPGRPSEAKDALWQSLEALGLYTALARRACVEDAQDITRHCVRCHQTYKEVDNNPSACKIYHSKPENYLPSQMRLWYACCVVWLEPGQYFENVYCFIGRHTGQRVIVSYNGANILTCEGNECASVAQETTEATESPQEEYDETLILEGSDTEGEGEEFEATQPVE
ncbi:hypothetical protein BKA70DRAFT_1325861 [Coprinopsis sp. MPI-PUGE-AT-0042]|nr:hypothetical protein BKA70DRAFT_1325861 [Coprinopsis sp. MPI-PUGE-AT-0042]